MLSNYVRKLQYFPRSPELALVAAAGPSQPGRTTRLACPTRPSTEAHETNYLVVADAGEVAEFLAGNDPRGTEMFAGAQALICDFGAPEERVSLTIFGPPLNGLAKRQSRGWNRSWNWC